MRNPNFKYYQIPSKSHPPNPKKEKQNQTSNDKMFEEMKKDKEKKASRSKMGLFLAFVLLFILAFASSICTTASAHECECSCDTKYHGTIHGGIYFDAIDTWMKSTNVTFHDVPAGIKIARVYIGIWDAHPGGGGNFTITVNGNTTPTYRACDPCRQADCCYPWQPERCDTLNWTSNSNPPSITTECHTYVTGCGVYFVAYNATPYINEGDNIVSLSLSNGNCEEGDTGWDDGRAYCIGLVGVYEDVNMPEIAYWLNEGTVVMDMGSCCCKCAGCGVEGGEYPETSYYFNETAYPGSVSDLKHWIVGFPHAPRVNPELNGKDIGDPDGALEVYGTDAFRWDSISPTYLKTSNNLFHYYNPDASFERVHYSMLMLNYSEPSELNVTDISPESLCVDWYNTIDARIVNNGGTASFFNVTLYANGDVIDVKRVTNLGEGENRTVKLFWKPSAIGPYVLNVAADVEGVVNETDKTNNSKILPVTVTEAQPPAWQSQSSNVSSIPVGGTIELRAQGIADVGLDTAILATDETGSWKNITDGRYDSPLDKASYYNYSLTHTSDSDWNSQTKENLSVLSGNVELEQILGDNIALNQPAFASSFTYPEDPSWYGPENAVDGERSCAQGSLWLSEYGDVPSWWKVDLGAEDTAIREIYIVLSDVYTRPLHYAIYTSNDNETWTWKEWRGYSDGEGDTFSGLDWSCRYINVSIIETFHSDYPDKYGGICEFEAYGPGDYKLNGTLASSTIETSNPIVAVTPTWNATNTTNTSISVNVSVDNGATWKKATNGTELTWDYNVHNTNLKYKVLFETTNVNETPVLHDISLDYTTRDPVEGTWLWSNFTWQNASIPEGTTVAWRIYYEDMLGQTNCTDVETFVVGAPGPAIELRREQANTTGVNQAATVRLIVWNTDSSVSNVTSLNLTEWIDSDWAVTDCGSCSENTSTYIKWNLEDLTKDNYTMVSYKIKASSSSEISTFKANCTYKYDEETGSTEGSEFNVTVESGKAFFDFELDMNAFTPTIDRDVPEGTEKTVLYSVTNVGDAVPCDTVFIELKINKTAWNVTCACCDEFYNDTDYYYLKWNEDGSSWAVQETKVFNFTVNSSQPGYYNFLSNGTYDPPASANGFIGQIYYPVLLTAEVGVGKDINGSDEPNASDVVPQTPIDDNSSLPHDDSATEHEEKNILYNDVNETIVTEIVEVTCNVQEQKQVLNIEAKLVYDVNETPIPNQEICFYHETALIGSELTNGEGWAVVSFDTSELPAGNYTINVIYEGNETLSNAAQQIEITLVSPTPTPTPTPTATAENETANETQEPQNITDDLTPDPPIVTLISPTNTTYNNTEIELNYTVNAPADWVAYSLNGLDNVTITGEGSTTLNASIDLNTLTVYANDSSGNVGSACVQFVVNLTNVTATAPEPENITAEITPVLAAMKEHFPLNEKPAFKFKFSVNAFSKRVGLKTLATPTETIKTAVYYKDELVDIEPEIEELREGEFCIEIPTKRAFQAGLYKLRVELVKDNVTYVEEQDFTWGVLAINTHKSIYLPNEAAFIGIAVLDDEGHMVCDAAITLTITDPDNKETVLSTDNGLIKISPECSVYGVTNLPDYYTNYEVKGVGTYVMDLTAVTPDGTKSITDEFTVQDSVDFDVVRDGPTRIYPPVPYTMSFIIKANKNYTGLIKEYVPASFVITPQQGLTVTTAGDTKILTWNKNLVKGETCNIYYEFDAPDVSPYLFVLGRLQIGSFEEKRDWMIVSDAPDTESLWSASNSVSSGLALTNSEYANGATTGTWAYATGKWAKSGYWWEFVMEDSAQTGTIDSVTLYLKHYQSGWDNDNFKIQIYDGSTWLDVQSYPSDGSPPTSDTTDNWDVKALGIDTWTEINAAKVRIIGNGASTGEDTVDWFVDTVELRIDYTSADTTPPTYTSDGDNSSGSVTEGTIVATHAYWTDADSNLGKAVLRTNKTGSWENESWHTFAGNPEWANITFNTTGHAGKTICWAQRANDTSNNWNTSMSTTAHCFNVLHVTNISQVLINNTNPAAGDIVKIEALLQYDNTSAIQNQNISFYYDSSYIDSDFTNSTGWATITWDTTGVPGGTRIINATYAGNASIYTSASYNNTQEVTVTGKIWVTNIEVHFVRVKSAAAMDTTPPASIASLHNTTYAPTYINWSWINPADTDFSHVMVYIDGTFKENVFSPLDYYTATGLLPNTYNTISTHTVDTSVNVNLSWVNHSAWTAPAPAGAPTVEIITITPDDDSSTSGVQINPEPGSTKTVTVTAQVNDPNGYEDIQTVEVSNINPAPTQGSTATMSCVSGSGSGTTATYEGTFDMQFYDASTNYTVTVTATDTGDLTGSNSSPFEYQTCIALALDVASIPFGSVDPGKSSEVTGDVNFDGTAPTIKNNGNVKIDMNISGTNMSGSGTIPVNNIYDDLLGDGYTALSNTPDEHDELNLTAGASSVHGIDFKLNVPSGTSAGDYSGTVTLEAKLDD